MLLNSKSDPTKLTDEELIQKFLKTGNKHFFGVLFQRYTHLIFGACMKYLKSKDESEDAVMDIFEKLMSELRSHEVRSFKGWIYTVSRNHCLMKIRSEKKMQMTNDERKLDGLVVEMPEPMHLSNKMKKEIALTNLEQALTKLSDEQRVCVELFYLQEKCYNEVSTITKYSLNEVKSYIQNGKRNLKNHLTTING
ncbi:MAG: sigma-70 family RNA polymerase sigma factor [Flavobacteriales bacterium]|nr:sigma-70 family RNA polymerase sigma factor [Flavobacteriales bacterium]